MKRVAVLGSTGSIGVNTLDVIARHPDRYAVAALAAASSHERLLEQCRAHRPRVAVLEDPGAARALEAALRAEGLPTEVACGRAALAEVAGSADVDVVMAAIVGAAGLPSTLAAARAGKRVLLANKESLVVAGRLLIEAAAAGGAELVPIDSEHNAIFQCLPPGGAAGRASPGVRRVLLTASGGPFLRTPADRLAGVTPDQACAHPRWKMGRKISVDSATLMNKGLEVIEAHFLFGAAASVIEVVVHPQSIVHSLVEYRDGSVLAQLGNPDMRTAIAHGLAWPERIEAGVPALNLIDIARLEFEAVDHGTFSCLGLAYQALAAGGDAPTTLNAANEEAVAAFLGGRLPFLAIAEVIEQCLSALPARPADGLDALLDSDLTARRQAQRIIARLAGC